MFRSYIDSSPFCTDAANAYFKTIKGPSYHGDYSLLSTVRALVYPRMKDGDTLSLDFLELPDMTKEKCEREGVAIDCNFTDEILIVTSDSDGVVEYADEYFIETHPGYEKIERVTGFFIKSFKVSCFANEEQRNVVLVVSPFNIRILHYLQCAIFAFLPWYFKKEDGVSDDEMEVIQSLREKNGSTRYMDALAKMAEQYDFRPIQLGIMLDGFEEKLKNARLRGANDEIETLEREYRRCSQRLSELIGKINRLKWQVSGYGSDDEDSMSVLEYLLCHKDIELVDPSMNHFLFIIKGYISYYDEGVAESVIGNKNSYMYQFARDISKEDLEDFYEEVFLNQEYGIRIRTCAAYSINTGENSLYGVEEYPYPETYSSYLPNQHIDRFGCLGNNHPIMIDCVKKGDFVGAIEQCYTSCQGFNFGDSYVGEYEFRKICRDKFKCFELPDEGTVVDIYKAVEWYKNKEEK